MAGGWMGVVERDAALEFGLRLWPLPIVEPQHGGHRRVSFAEIGGEAEGRPRGGFGFWGGGPLGGGTVSGRGKVGKGGGGYGGGGRGVFFSGVLEIVGGFFRSRSWPL